MARTLADGGLGQPTKYTTSADGAPPNLRRSLVDLNEEYARHIGQPICCARPWMVWPGKITFSSYHIILSNQSAVHRRFLIKPRVAGMVPEQPL
jgi:hypothetical protein